MNGRKVEKFWDKISSTGCKWFNLNAPSTETHVSDPFLVNSLFPYSSFLSHWGNKELDLPLWMVGKWKNFGTKSAQQAANGSIWMPRVLKPLCLFHLIEEPLIPFLCPPTFSNPIASHPCSGVLDATALSAPNRRLTSLLRGSLTERFWCISKTFDYLT